MDNYKKDESGSVKLRHEAAVAGVEWEAECPPHHPSHLCQHFFTSDFYFYISFQNQNGMVTSLANRSAPILPFEFNNCILKGGIRLDQDKDKEA